MDWLRSSVHRLQKQQRRSSEAGRGGAAAPPASDGPPVAASIPLLVCFWLLVSVSSAAVQSLHKARGDLHRCRCANFAAPRRNPNPPTPPPPQKKTPTPQGLLNNSAYVICLALATEISSGGVGLVYFAAIAPTIAVKATVSLWYHRVPAKVRMASVAALMAAAYLLIAFGGSLQAQVRMRCGGAEGSVATGGRWIGWSLRLPACGCFCAINGASNSLLASL